MINVTLLRQDARSNAILTAIFASILSMYVSIMIYMFDPAIGEMFAVFQESMPDLAGAMGMSQPATTLTNYLASYLYDFILLVFPLIFVAILTNRLVAKHIDRGSMACLLATPHKRSTIILTQVAALLLAILVLVAWVIGLSLIMCHTMFPGELDVRAYLSLNLGLLALHLFLGSVCFCACCVPADASLGASLGAGLIAVLFLVKLLSQAGEKLAWLRYATPFTLFDPTGIVDGSQQALLLLIPLFVGALVLFGLGVVAFTRKDLPL